MHAGVEGVAAARELGHVVLQQHAAALALFLVAAPLVAHGVCDVYRRLVQRIQRVAGVRRRVLLELLARPCLALRPRRGPGRLLAGSWRGRLREHRDDGRAATTAR